MSGVLLSTNRRCEFSNGQGLSLPLNQFEVSLPPGAAVLLKLPVDSQAASHWSLKQLSLGHDYAGAIAVKGNSWQLKCWQWLSKGTQPFCLCCHDSFDATPPHYIEQLTYSPAVNGVVYRERRDGGSDQPQP